MTPLQNLVASFHTLLFGIAFSVLVDVPVLHAYDWTIDSEDDWTENIKSAEGAEISGGFVSPVESTATVISKIHTFDDKRSARSLLIKQSPVWQNWIPIENLGPANLGDAPVLLTVGPKNYWMFGRYRSSKPRRKKGAAKQTEPAFQPESATLAGFDMPLQTTPFPNQFNALSGNMFG